MKYPKSIVSATVLAAFFTHTSAQITVVSDAGDNYAEMTGSAGSISIDYTPTAVGNVLVAMTYSDGSAATNFTFGGVAAAGSITESRGTMAYFETTGTSLITVSADSGATSGGIYLYELSGVDLSAGVVSSVSDIPAGTASITTTKPNSLLISFASANPGTPPPAPNASSVITSVDATQMPGGSSGGDMVAGSALVSSAATYNVSWDFGQNPSNSSRSILTYSFAPVPEPSSFALLAGLTMLGWVVVRRR
ncbi:MAG: PEP-CTERM sorting domain-containing protein [Verrucomicrobiota bacterium]